MRSFHDGTGGLTRARAALNWYPDDVWRYVLSCQWSRIAEEEAFGGRCAEAGDELGSAVVTARLARDLMRLWLLMHRRFPPYSKWLGSAFARAPGSAGLGRHLAAALAAAGWPARERELVLAYRIAAVAHNGSASPNPSTPGPGPTSTVRTRSSTPGASPPPCPARSPTRWSGGSGRPAPPIRSWTARRPSAISATPGP